MSQSTHQMPDDAKQVRLVAIVLASTMVLWMLASFVGGQLGLPARFAFLFDFMALGAFAWALIVVARIWRSRRQARAQAQSEN